MDDFIVNHTTDLLRQTRRNKVGYDYSLSHKTIISRVKINIQQCGAFQLVVEKGG